VESDVAQPWIPANRILRHVPNQEIVDSIYSHLRTGLTLIGIAITTNDRDSSRTACKKARDLLAEAVRLDDAFRASTYDQRLQRGIDSLDTAIRQLEQDALP
jgi:hypothetical protein